MLKFRELYEPNVSGAMLPTFFSGMAMLVIGVFISSSAHSSELLPTLRKVVGGVLGFSGIAYIIFVWISVILEWENRLSRRALRRVRKALDLLRR